MVSLKDALEIITVAEENGIEVYLDGGWGVDALLETQTREHEDIDIFIEKRHGETALRLLKSKDFFEVEKEYTSPDHSVWKDDKGRIIDLHLFEFSENGLIFEGAIYPGDVFCGEGTIGGKAVKCIGAAYQVMFHLGYEHDEKDAHDVKLLCERFDIPMPDEYKKYFIS
ncbi:MAG: aminoglycoside nucleotidyltransferase [Clostridiales bacterium]|nr:aminoglycoside nucleotidyltransferase [Clostridiales bacterium]